MIHRVFSCLLVLTLAVARPAFGLDAGTAAERYNHAGSLYQDGDFAGALSVYEDLMDQGISDADVFYNASNAAYRTGSLGKAILYCERALRLAPSDKDAQANRAFLDAMKKDRDPEPTNAVTAFFATRYARVTADGAVKASITLWITALALAALGLFVGTWRRITALSLAGVALISWCTVTGIFVEKVYSASHTTQAVVLASEVEAYSGPGEDNTHIFTLHEGTTVVVERSQDAWSLVHLKSGAGGWIRSATASDI